MIYYSQKDVRWAKDKLGGYSSFITLGEDGCYLTSIAMLDGRNPKQINGILTTNKCFVNGDELDNFRAAHILGFTYKEVTVNPNIYPTICETNHYAKIGYRQHFFVMTDKNTRIDPLDLKPAPEPNNYNIVSWSCYTTVYS